MGWSDAEAAFYSFDDAEEGFKSGERIGVAEFLAEGVDCCEVFLNCGGIAAA